MIPLPVATALSFLPRVMLAASLGVVAYASSNESALQTVFAREDAPAARMLEEVGAVPDELRESSGIAISRTQPGVLWSHNDSGDGPNLYAIDEKGTLLAKVPVTDAMARDWEDISLGPCPAAMGAPDPKGRHCLFIADTGDNNQIRSEVSIYIVIEPRVTPKGAEPATVQARSFRYRYPKGPNDAEALAVRSNGDLEIVTKGRTGTIDFFSIPADTAARALASGEIVTAQYDGNSGIRPDARSGRLVTSAALSPDGKTLAVRTYYEVYFFGLVNLKGEARWRDLHRTCSLGDAEPQGEAIDYLDANTLLLTSERSRGRPGSIHRLRC